MPRSLNLLKKYLSVPTVTCIMLGAEDMILNEIGPCPHGDYILVVILYCSVIKKSRIHRTGVRLDWFKRKGVMYEPYLQGM